MDCIFCKIMKKELPSGIRHEDDDFLAFDDLHPKASTHVLVIPKAHFQNLDNWLDATPDNTAHMLNFVAETAREIGVSGAYRLITNVGEAAGQEIHHLHWHILAGENLPGFK